MKNGFGALVAFAFDFSWLQSEFWHFFATEDTEDHGEIIGKLKDNCPRIINIMKKGVGVLCLRWRFGFLFVGFGRNSLFKLTHHSEIYSGTRLTMSSTQLD